MLDPKLSRRRGAMAVAVLAVLVAGYPAPAPAQYADRLVQARQIVVETRATALELDNAKFKDVALTVIAGWQVAAQDVPEALRTLAAITEASPTRRPCG